MTAGGSLQAGCKGSEESPAMPGSGVLPAPNVPVRYPPLGSPWTVSKRPYVHVQEVTAVRSWGDYRAVQCGTGVGTGGYYTGYSPRPTGTALPFTSSPAVRCTACSWGFPGSALGGSVWCPQLLARGAGCAEGPAGPWSDRRTPNTRPRTNKDEIPSNIS